MTERRSSHFWWPVCAILLLTALPYIWGWFIAVDRHYVWINRNLDDNMVYLAWMRQAADGSFFFTNRWTAETHPSLYTNLLFWLMGITAKITHIPLVGVFHITRILGTVGLLGMVWFAAKQWLGVRYQRLVIWVVGTSAGFGWLFIDNRPKDMVAPIDAWQPEAITFLSVYLNPLFVISLILIICTNLFLWLSLEHRQLKWACIAGLCAFLLGNIHSYDVIPIAVTWVIYGVTIAVKSREDIKRFLLHSLTCALIASPSVIWQYLVYKHDPVFHARVGTSTPAPAVYWVILGFGLLLPLAIIGLYKQKKQACLSSSHYFLLSWTIAGLFTQYIPHIIRAIGIAAPLNFERKMVMGVHIPICLLASIGIMMILQKQQSLSRNLALPVLLLFMSLSNLVWIYRDGNLLYYNVSNTGLHQPYIEPNRWTAFNKLQQFIKRDDVVLCPVSMGVFIPVQFGARTYAGHWSETPDFPAKMKDLLRFYNPTSSDLERKQFLMNNSSIRWVVSFHGQPLWEQISLQRPFDNIPENNQIGLRAIYTDSELTLFEVNHDEEKP